MIYKVKIDREDSIKILKTSYESRGFNILLFQLLKNYNYDNEKLINKIYYNLLNKIIEEKLTFQSIILNYVSLEDSIYNFSFDPNSGIISYDKKFNVQVNSIYDYSLDKLLEYSPYQYINQNKLLKIKTGKNEQKIDNLLKDINFNNNLFKKEDIFIQNSINKNNDECLFYDCFNNKIIIFKKLGVINE